MAREISVDKTSVKKLLESGKEKLFVIPEYQRPYVWDEEKVETLFNDIWEFTIKYQEDDTATYFLGSVVSYNDEQKSRQEIIDGQQRITSLFLMLRAIYTKLSKEKEHSKEASFFASQIEPAIWKTNKHTGEVDFSQTLLKSEVINDEGNAILASILETGQTKEKAKDSYSRNYNKFLELYEKASKENHWLIYDFLHSLLNKAILLPIIADNKDTALTIFSTLNDRGEPLSDSDIFKADIYNNLEEKNRKQFINDWKLLEEDARVIDESIQRLFYYYMFYLRAIDKDDKTTTPGLRKYFFSDEAIRLHNKELLPNLTKILDFWKVINRRGTVQRKETENLDEDIVEDEKQETSWSTNIDILKILDCLTDYPNEFWKYPVIIYYLKYSDDNDFQENFLLFLRRFYTHLLTKYLEIPTINFVKSFILKLNVEIINSKKPKFDGLDINNNEFKKKLKTPHVNTVRMLLKTMAYMEEEQKELLPEKWEIEHIFPQKWHSNYFTNVSDEEIFEKIEHLGNKVPLEKKINIEAGNGYFGKKKEKYKVSKIEVARKLSELTADDWNLDDITDRDSDVATAIQALLVNWIKNYDDGVEIIDVGPTLEDLKKIEEFRSKGWLN